ncbi:MAG: aminotransferase class III-fold pyridoxal phosphate-dependent enzyme [Bacteroidota bacterium]
MSEMSFESLQISTELAEHFASNIYGLRAKAKILTGEVDFNFLLETPKGERYTLKVSRPNTSKIELSFQAAMMDFLAGKSLPFQIPKVVKTKRGRWGQQIIDEDGRERWVRLQQWIEGEEIIEVNPRNKQLFRAWGTTCGHLSNALQGFDHPYAHRHFRWDPSQVLDTRVMVKYVDDETQKSLLEYFWDLFIEEVEPLRDKLRKSVNHDDGHDRNVLILRQPEGIQVSGVIDFGDAVYTETVNELAIACAYAAMEQEDPLSAVCEVVAGYHQVFSLQTTELKVLMPLICARLVITVSIAAQNRVLEPENAYLQVSDVPAWDVLSFFRNIDPAFAEMAFRHACGLEPCPKRAFFDHWLKTKQPTFKNVVKLQGKTIHLLDLSVGGSVLGNNSQYETAAAMHRTIFRYLEDQKCRMGIGGYCETRPFYTTDAYEVIGNSGPQWRTVHIGLDFWEKADTPVYAPYKGRVHSFQDNAAERDYGPTIILEHSISDDFSFYTLYGHLSLDSISDLEIGQEIDAGTEIARIGPAPENGNWPTHLHFQVMLDTLGKTGDFPGVAFPNELPIWKSLCPDPKSIVPDLQGISIPEKKINQQQLLEKRHKVLGRSLSVSYQKPLTIVRGFGAYLYADDGRRYLDCVNNVAHVGHEHPKVVNAGQYQMRLLNTNTRYLHPSVIEYAESLLAKFPPEHCVVHFVNSGSEANELALRMAEAIRGSREMIAIEVGYHGNTGRTIDVSSYKFDGKGGRGAPDYTQILPMPDVFRGPHRDPTTAGEAYAKYVDQAIAKIESKGASVAGFIGESILSCGGQIVLPEGYLPAVYKKIRAAGGLCIADEVQVGFGRVGEHFWGFELQGVVPDIVTLGKPIGNGHPMGAVVCTRAVADAFANGMEFFTTFGGNPVSSEIGKTVLDVIEEEKLQQNALEVGQRLKQGLITLQSKYPVIGDVRGHGLFLGFELVKNLETREPLPAVASYIVNRMRDYGILLSTDGPDHNVIKIKPPMCFSAKNVDFLCTYLEKVCQEDFVKFKGEISNAI